MSGRPIKRTLRGQRTTLGNAFIYSRSHQPVLHHPRVQERADECEQSRVGNAPSHVTH